MLLDIAQVNNEIVSIIKIVNIGHTENFDEVKGYPEECKYRVEYYKPAKVVKKHKHSEVFKTLKHFHYMYEDYVMEWGIEVIHDRLFGHSELIMQCRRIAFEIENGG